jgi:NAD+ dependent glucose-6-phosphate dehydrogenase
MATKLRIVLTGATGNLGRKLDQHWRGQHDVLGIDLDTRGDEAVVGADLSVYDPRWAARLVAADVVVHGAANGSPSQDWEAGQRNIRSTFNVLEAARAGGVRRVVFISSNHVMGGYKDLEAPQQLTTALAPRPGTAWQRDGRAETSLSYGLGKLCGEEIAHCFAATHGLEVVCVRVGWVQAGENRVADMPAQMDQWTRAMWLSNGDLCRLMDACVGAPLPERFLIVNGMSANQGMRWDIASARAIGYAPQDSYRG